MIRPGRDVLHVGEAAHLADAPADQAAEDHEVQRRGDRGRHDRLPPDADDPAELADHDRAEADPAVRLGGPRGSGRRSPRAVRWRCSWRRRRSRRQLPALPTSRPSTSRRNSSSSRFALLRMLSTSMPCAGQRREDAVQVLLLVDLDLERVVVGQLHAVARQRRQLRRSGSRRFSTNTSVCSLRSTVAMRSFSMMRPSSMIAMLRQSVSASSR